MTNPPEEFVSSFEEEEFGTTIVRNIKQKPAAIIGLTGMVGACGYAYWRFKTKGYLVSPSLFLMQLRVGAQSVVVGCITLGMLYNLYQTQMQKRSKQN